MPQSDLERAIARYRADLLANESRATLAIANAYKATRARLMKRIDDLAESIAEEGAEFTPSQVLKWQRAKTLLRQVEAEMSSLATASSEPITQGQATAVEMAGEQAKGLALATAQSAGADAIAATIDTTWNRLNTSAAEQMVGRMSDGSPLDTWLDQFGSKAGSLIAESLQSAAALGTNPRAVARELAKQVDVSAARLLMTSRTEILNAQRSATLQNYRDNEDIVSGWIWISAHQTRTCFPVGTLVSTRRGDVPIESVRVGDDVLTHRCEWQRVYETLSRSYDGQMVTVIAGDRKVTATSSHPFFVERDGQLNWIEAGDLKVGDTVFVRRDGDIDFADHGIGDRSVEWSGVQPENPIAARSQEPRLPFVGVSAFVVPIGLVNFEHEVRVRQVEVDRVAPSFDDVFLTKPESKSSQTDTGVRFGLSLSSEAAITPNRAELPARTRVPIRPRWLRLNPARINPKLFRAIETGDDDSGASAGFRAMLSAAGGAKQLPATRARLFLPHCFNRMSAFRRAENAIRTICGDYKRALTDRTPFVSSPRLIMATLRAELRVLALLSHPMLFAALDARCFSLRLGGTSAGVSAVRMNGLMGCVASLRAKLTATTFDSRRGSVELRSARAANTVRTDGILSGHFDDLQERSDECRARTVDAVPGTFDPVIITDLTYSTEQLQVYNIEVENDHSYVAGGFVAHNCLACLALDGKFFNLSVTFQGCHPACRCSSRAAVKGVDYSRRTRTGKEWFEGLPEESQRGMIPAGAWDDFSAGKIQLEDFIYLDKDEQWGDRYRQASIVTARDNAKRRGQGFNTPTPINQPKSAPKGKPVQAPTQQTAQPATKQLPGRLFVPDNAPDDFELTGANQVERAKSFTDYMESMGVKVVDKEGNPVRNSYSGLFRNVGDAYAKRVRAGEPIHPVLVIDTSTNPKTPGGYARYFRGDEFVRSEMVVNPRNPYWTDPRAAGVKNKSAGFWSGDDSDHVITHEMGHALHLEGKPDSAYSTEFSPGQKVVANRISRYGATQPIEFVAETYAGLRSGQVYDDEVMTLYRELQGPEVKPSEDRKRKAS